MATATRTIRAHFDGRCFVPDEPVDLAPDTAVEVSVPDYGPTWAEVHFGIPRLIPSGQGPTTDEIISEQRGAD